MKEILVKNTGMLLNPINCHAEDVLIAQKKNQEWSKCIDPVDNAVPLAKSMFKV